MSNKNALLGYVDRSFCKTQIYHNHSKFNQSTNN